MAQERRVLFQAIRVIWILQFAPTICPCIWVYLFITWHDIIAIYVLAGAGDTIHPSIRGWSVDGGGHWLCLHHAGYCWLPRLDHCGPDLLDLGRHQVRKTASCFSAFPMFVPSLSWQNVRFYLNGSKMPFFAGAKTAEERHSFVCFQLSDDEKRWLAKTGSGQMRGNIVLKRSTPIVFARRTVSSA